MDFLNDFSPMILANPKSHNFARGIPISDVSSTFSGLRSQCTMSRLCRYWRAIRIYMYMYKEAKIQIHEWMTLCTCTIVGRAMLTELVN